MYLWKEGYPWEKWNTFYDEACHSGRSSILVGEGIPYGRGHAVAGGVSLWEGYFLVEEAVPCDSRRVLVGMGTSLWEGACPFVRSYVIEELHMSLRQGILLVGVTCPI